MSSKSFPGGIHPPGNKKTTESLPIEKCPAPPSVVIPLQQHIGAPSKPIVATGDALRIGDSISESGGFVSVPSHATVSGTVSAIEVRPHPLGVKVLSVVIENDGQEKWRDDIGFDENYRELGKKEMINRIHAAGLAGMGGATFPTHVKLSPPADKKIDTLILNGAECEPYLTSDHRLMLEEPEKIVRGMEILFKILGAKSGAIGIEGNKPDAIKVMRQKIAELGLPFKIHALHVKYPQGAEKQLIKAITNRRVPAGGLPMDIGCVVHNVGTAAAVYDAVACKRPLVERVVTITGAGVKTPKNLLIPIGTPFSHVFNHCGGLTDDAGKIIMGGPMMGLAQSDLAAPVIKGTSGLLVLNEKQSRRKQEQPCISCAHCVDACPMALLPKMLSQFVKHERFASAESYNILDCIECGSCAFVCPANINLVHWIKYGKLKVMQKRKKAN
ncbi:electron transport complex subunit RsxC [candidate division KSB1 bacterium]|nr:electron transport complex subunit RsxC [candidate division KSB1 bacterium]